MSFTDTLGSMKKELEDTLTEGTSVDDMIDPKGEGTVKIPVALYFQLLGIVTWLAIPEDTDGYKLS